MTLQQAFSTLHTKLGSHKDAAAFVGLSKEHYSMIRNGRVHVPRRTEELIILKAREARGMGRLANAHQAVNV